MYETLFEIAANEVTKILKQYISNKIKPKNQNHKHATYTYSPTHKNDTHIFKQDAKIDWSKSHKQIYAAIRAYHPWPVAWTTISELENLNTKIKIKSNKNPNLMVKIHKAYLDKNGHIVIENLQVEGKNIMTWDDFCNGYLVSSF